MANDALDYKERHNKIQSIIDLLRLSQKANADLERYYDRRAVPSSSEVLGKLWTDMDLRMIDVKNFADQAKIELDNLITNNGFYVKYVWEIGLADVVRFTFDTAADTVAIYGRSIGGAFQNLTSFHDSGASLVVNNGDIVRVTGTDDNDALYSITSASSTSQTLDLTAAATTEICDNIGAKIELWTIA